MSNHSNLSINFFSAAAIFFIGMFVIAGIPGSASAQMFSVGNDRPRFDIPRTELYLGLEPMEVRYHGSPTNTNAGIYSFDGPIIRAGYNSSTLDLFIGTGGEITGLDDVAYFDFGGNIDIGINLYTTENLFIQLPLRIASRFTNITNSNRGIQGFDRFRFGSLTAGAGGRILARPGEQIRIEASAVPSYGFSFASGGLFGGSLGSFSSGVRLYFDRLFGDFGLSAGYKYDFRNYNVDEDEYDYKMKSHSIQLGITF